MRGPSRSASIVGRSFDDLVQSFQDRLYTRSRLNSSSARGLWDDSLPLNRASSSPVQSCIRQNEPEATESMANFERRKEEKMDVELAASPNATSQRVNLSPSEGAARSGAKQEAPMS